MQNTWMITRKNIYNKIKNIMKESSVQAWDAKEGIIKYL